MNDIEQMIRILEFADTGFSGEKTKPARRFLPLAAAAAIVALALVLAMHRRAPKGPVDTYDNPELAYAKMEEAFDRISGSIEKCMTRTEKTYQKITCGHE